MKITISPDTPRHMEDAILASLKTQLFVVFRAAAAAIKARIGLLAGKIVSGTPEYDSLVNGELLGELGIPDVETRLQQIIATIANHIVVRPNSIQTRGRKLSGGISAYILREGYQDLLELSASSYISAPSGSNIKWLEWLLEQGDMILVYGYDVTFDLSASERYRSRTGQALMKPGQGWRVPPEFSGTENDNFLTRAFNVSAAQAAISSIFREEILRRV